MTTLSEMLFPSSSEERQPQNLGARSEKIGHGVSSPILPPNSDDDWFIPGYTRRYVTSNEERRKRRQKVWRESKQHQRSRDRYVLRDGGGIKPIMVIKCGNCGSITLAYQVKRHQCNNCNGYRTYANEEHVLLTTYDLEEAKEMRVRLLMQADGMSFTQAKLEARRLLHQVASATSSGRTPQRNELSALLPETREVGWQPQDHPSSTR